MALSIFPLVPQIGSYTEYLASASPTGDGSPDGNLVGRLITQMQSVVDPLPPASQLQPLSLDQTPLAILPIMIRISSALARLQSFSEIFGNDFAALEHRLKECDSRVYFRMPMEITIDVASIADGLSRLDSLVPRVDERIRSCFSEFLARTTETFEKINHVQLRSDIAVARTFSVIQRYEITLNSSTNDQDRAAALSILKQEFESVLDLSMKELVHLSPEQSEMLEVYRRRILACEDLEKK